MRDLETSGRPRESIFSMGYHSSRPAQSPPSLNYPTARGVLDAAKTRLMDVWVPRLLRSLCPLGKLTYLFVCRSPIERSLGPWTCSLRGRRPRLPSSIAIRAGHHAWHGQIPTCGYLASVVRYRSFSRALCTAGQFLPDSQVSELGAWSARRPGPTSTWGHAVDAR